MDKLTPEKRSWNMGRIRSKNSKPEMIVRSLLHGLGYRFRIHRKDLPGKPDIVLSKYNTVIFVHGCFWHRHEDCKYSYNPKSKQDFWETKFKRTVERDYENQKELVRLGWNVLILWECEIKNTSLLEIRLRHFL